MDNPQQKGIQRVLQKSDTGLAQNQPEEVQHVTKCHSCGSSTLPGADICESCGEWLLTGQCRICYKPFQPGQKFCGGCGNPPEGIQCRNCGTFVQFDFCPTCESPVSKRSSPYLEQILKSPDLQQVQKQIQEITSPPAEGQVTMQPNLTINDELQKYYSESETKEPPSAPSNQSKLNSENKDFGDVLREQEDSLAKQFNELSSSQREDALQLIRSMQEKAFSNNQEARLYYMSIKHVIPRLNLNLCASFLGWKCVYTGTVHFGGPSSCACPSMGGHWVCNDGVEWNERQDEFIYEGVVYYVTDANELPPSQP